MICCCNTVSSAETENPPEKAQHKIEPKTLTVYISAIEANFDMDFYFMDGVTDLPWIDIESASGLMSGLADVWRSDEGYELQCETEGETITLTRENSFYMTFDFAQNIISCLDYNMFATFDRLGSDVEFCLSD